MENNRNEKSGGPFSSGENGKKLDKMRKQILYQEELNRIHDRENRYKERQKGVL